MCQPKYSLGQLVSIPVIMENKKADISIQIYLNGIIREISYFPIEKDIHECHDLYFYGVLLDNAINTISVKEEEITFKGCKGVK